jgi:hypothetical protein
MKQQLKKIYQKSKYYLPPILFDKLIYLRAYKGFLKYKDLVSKNIELKDKHKGERCFILGSGPSIKKEDLKPLKNEIVFALNNFYVHPDFDIIMSGEKAKYYMTAPIHPPQTEDEWREWFSDMEKHIPKTTTMLLGLNSYKGNIKYIFDKYSLFNEHKIYWYYAGRQVNEYYQFNKKDIDITNMIWSANTVSIYALIFAIYMGFDEIYLVGMDHTQICNTSPQQTKIRFYDKAKHQKNEKPLNVSDKLTQVNQYMSRYIQWKQYFNLSELGVKIYNTSDESLLKLFDYKSLKEVINDS